MSLDKKHYSILQSRPENIRNVCILAHVDHGKTSLADNLIASNGFMAQNMCGKQLYLDSREDEKKRGITMKCSSMCLFHVSNKNNYLINLIDSPGHVDFSGEVSTAVRLCDGAIIVVDVIEGVCSQTKVTLHQAWTEHIRPILVLNKIDKLILEKKLTPIDAYLHLQQVLEQVNVEIAHLFTSEAFGKVKINQDSEKLEIDDELGDLDDSKVYFSPEQGNVLFSSCYDGWGFGIKEFAAIYATKLKMNELVLQKTLWGDFYYDNKLKRVKKGARVKCKKPLFVQLILDNIWSLYEMVMIKKDKEALNKIVDTLNIKLTRFESKPSKDPRIALQAVCSKWLPLYKSVLDMICKIIPSPLELPEERIEQLMCNALHKFNSLPPQSQQLKKDFQACSSSPEAPVIVSVSKMFPFNKKNLPQFRNRLLTMEEVQEMVKEKQRKEQEGLQLQTEEYLNVNERDTKDSKDQETVFIAFARVFSGVLKKGSTVYVLGPKYDPVKYLSETAAADIDRSLTLSTLPSNTHVTVATLDNFYMLMGANLEDVDEVPAGNIIGIGGLEEHVLKSATLSSELTCPPFTNLQSTSTPILRVALEPINPLDLETLKKGLQLLNQADPCVQVLMQETGELILVTAGEIHLQKCLVDLKENFAKVEISVSPPIVPFKETIIAPPKVDRVNEILEDTNKTIQKEDPESILKVFTTSNKQVTIKITAVPLPDKVTHLLLDCGVLLKAQSKVAYNHFSKKRKQELSEETLKLLEELYHKLKLEFDAAGSFWDNAIDQIWCFGPHRCGPNVLLNRIPGHNRPSIWKSHLENQPEATTLLLQFDGCFSNGFQLTTLSGPMCEEPMMGVCFVIEDCVFNDQCSQEFDLSDELKNLSLSSTHSSSLSAQIIKTIKEGCRKAFQSQPQRLMAAMYTCKVLAQVERIGKMYAVLNRRQGRVVYNDINEGTPTFTVKAALPVIESFDFAREMLIETRGLALPQLIFSHWEVIDMDPFWVPNTEKEYTHFGEKADSENKAREYMNQVRKRKGLVLDEKIVEHGEKQRTLNKNR